MVSCKEHYSTSLQSLKGIAALMVYFSHALGMCKNEAIHNIRSSFLNMFVDGQCAVALFLCLTGFFSYIESDWSNKRYINSIKKKIIRIYIPYIIITIIGWCVANLNLEYDEASFSNWSNTFWQHKITINYLMRALVLLFPFDTDVLNCPVWYIQVDMRMAFILPVIVYCLYRLGRYKIPAILAVIISCSIFKPPFGLMFLTYYGGGFFLKMIMMHMNKVVSILQQKWTRLLLFYVGVSLLGLYNIIGIPESIAPVWMRIFQVIGATMVVAFFYVNGLSQFDKIFSRLGNISYEVYLIHFIVLLTLRSLGLSIIAYLVVSFIMTLLLAFLLERYISSPLIFFLKSFFIK